MKRLEFELTRLAYLKTGSFGRLVVMSLDYETQAREQACETVYTVEPPWLGNELFVSCIPEGEYELSVGAYNRGRGYRCLVVNNVPGRSEIKFHRANWPHELEGCVAPNLRLISDDSTILRGLDSEPALNLLMSTVDSYCVGKVLPPMILRIGHVEAVLR